MQEETEDENLKYEIETSLSEDVITIFKTISISEDTISYIYHAMKNKLLITFIEEITKPYIEKKISGIFYEIMDGWVDFWKHKNNIVHTKKAVVKVLINIIRTDNIKLDLIYINMLQNEFEINYYAETMAG